jgi:hypothetical protein
MGESSLQQQRNVAVPRDSAARYYYVLNSAAVNPVNLNATYSETYTWVDRNGDLQPDRHGRRCRIGGSYSPA